MSDAIKDGFGLDKKSRLDAKRAAEEATAEASAALDPPFPFQIIPIDPEFLEIQFDA